MRRLAVLVGVFVVIAGCNAPGVTDTPDAGERTPTVGGETTTATTQPSTTATTQTTTETPTPPTESPTPTPPQSPETLTETYEFEPSGELPYDAQLVFARTALLLDRPGAEPPNRVTVRPRSELETPTQFGDFAATLRIEPPPDRAVLPAFTDGRTLTITLSEGLNDRPAFAEATFTQEAAHVIQFRNDADGRLRAAIVDGTRPTVDEALTYRAMIEGPAVYTESVYQRQYLDRNRTRIDTLRADYRNATGAARLSFGIYHFGSTYAATHTDDPAETWALYDNPPRTSEELLHDLEPGSEPVAELAVDASVAGYEEARPARTTMGELFLRTTLATNLSEVEAARGADGWGVDRRLAFVAEGERRPSAYAWVHRWDTASEADEFLTVMAAYLNETTTPAADARRVWTAADDRYRLVRVAPETTVLLLGDSAFLNNASVAGTNDEVSLTANVTSESVDASGLTVETRVIDDHKPAVTAVSTVGSVDPGDESVPARVVR